MKHSVLILLFVCLFSSVSAAETVSFDRRLKQGEVLDCMVHTEQSRRYSFRMPGKETPVVKLETVKVAVAGRMTVEQVNAAGNPLRLRFRIQSLSGFLDGVPVNAADAAGRVLTADLNVSPVKLIPETGSFSPGILTLLRAVFRPAHTNRLADLTGTEYRLNAPGETWKPDLALFCRTLQERKIRLTPSDIAASVTYTGKDRFRDLECYGFRLKIESKRSTAYDFRFSATVQLPVDPAAGPPVRITREATEIVSRTMPQNNPFAAGAEVELISKDASDLMMFPVRFLKEKTAAPEKESFWDSILR